jgi:hypothetical protein
MRGREGFSVIEIGASPVEIENRITGLRHPSLLHSLIIYAYLAADDRIECHRFGTQYSALFEQRRPSKRFLTPLRVST